MNKFSAEQLILKLFASVVEPRNSVSIIAVQKSLKTLGTILQPNQKVVSSTSRLSFWPVCIFRDNRRGKFSVKETIKINILRRNSSKAFFLRSRGKSCILHIEYFIESAWLWYFKIRLSCCSLKNLTSCSRLYSFRGLIFEFERELESAWLWYRPCLGFRRHLDE